MSKGMFNLEGKVVLATGANSGIGLGFLMVCAKQGRRWSFSKVPLNLARGKR